MLFQIDFCGYPYRLSISFSARLSCVIDVNGNVCAIPGFDADDFCLQTVGCSIFNAYRLCSAGRSWGAKMVAIKVSAMNAAQAAIGRKYTQSQLIDVESLRRFSIAIGATRDVEFHQPALAFWAWFLPQPTDDEIGSDGHPAGGGFLPTFEGLTRRMFASSVIVFAKPLEMDASAQLESAIAAVRCKAGQSGNLVFIEIERLLIQAGETCVSERQTLVYREAGEPAPLPQLARDRGAAAGLKHDEIWIPTPVNLFRFSAATFNGHRIHYDWRYATEVEGYPSLVVHGPLIAARLADLAAREGDLSTFSFRAIAPCFVDQPIGLVRTADSEFRAIRCDGVTAMIADATYRN